MTSTLLLIDDDVFLQRSVAKLLKGAGYEIVTAGTCQDAMKLIRENPPDLAILDVGLPDGDGYSLCALIRKEFTFPIIMLTARGDVVDKVGGLEAGADDYLTKPFSPEELQARVKAHLRRQDDYATGSPVKTIGHLEIDFDKRDVFVDGKPAGLKNREFELFSHLAAHQGKALSREALFTHSWGYEMSFNTNSLDVYIYRLRQKLERDPDQPEYIHTLRGYGYKLEFVPVD